MRKKKPELLLRDAFQVSANLDYYEWLYDLVELPNHRELLKHLRRIDFYCIIEKDHNREDDGKSLRTTYINLGGAHSPSPLTECSVLEMLIGLAFRMEHELSGLVECTDIVDCFLILLENLELSFMNDNRYLGGNGAEVVDDRIYNMLDRRYRFDGSGGLFPIKTPNQDQTEVEIWYQMHNWMLENYVF